MYFTGTQGCRARSENPKKRRESYIEVPGPWIEHGTFRMRTVFSLLLSQLSYPGAVNMVFMITYKHIVSSSVEKLRSQKLVVN